MADQTIAANKIHKTKIAIGGELDKLKSWVEEYDVAGSDISAGLAVVFETDGDLDLPAAAEAVGGVVLDYANVAQAKENYSLGVTLGQTDVNNKDIKALVLNIRKSLGRIVCQMVLSRSTTTAAAVVRNTPLFAEAGSGKVTATNPGHSTAVKEFVGYLDEDVSSGTADKVVKVRV